MRPTTGCGSCSSSRFSTNRRSARPWRSTRCISLAMNVSDRRGKPVRTYAIELAGSLSPASGIGAREDLAEVGGAAAELEATLDERPPLPGKACSHVGTPGEGRERVRERGGISRRDEETRLARPDGGRDRSHVARDHGAPARERFEDHVGKTVAVARPVLDRRYHDDVRSRVFTGQPGVRARPGELDPV